MPYSTTRGGRIVTMGGRLATRQNLGTLVTPTTYVAPAITTPGRWGVGNGEGYVFHDGFDNLTAGPQTMVRITVPWDAVENTQGSFVWTSWSGGVRNFETELTAAWAEGLEVLVCWNAVPSWARATADGRFSYPASNTSNQAALNSLLSRYGVSGSRVATLGGTVGQGIKYIEFHNENNIITFAKPAPNPTAYANWLMATYTWLKTNYPTVSLITAGLAPSGPSAGIKPYTFFQGVVDRIIAPSYTTPTGGWGPWPFDGVGHHPYNWGRNGTGATGSYYTLGVNHADNAFANDTVLLLNILNEHNLLVAGTTGVKLWMTECGCPHHIDFVLGGTVPGGSGIWDRRIANGAEAYTHMRSLWRYAQGDLAWPVGTALVPFEGPGSVYQHIKTWFIFETRDREGSAGVVKGQAEAHFGLLNNSRTTIKTAVGATNDLWDAFLEASP